MEGFAAALAFVLLHSLWQCALLALASALTLRAMRPATAAARHAAAMAFLIAMALAPVVQILIYANADAPPPGELPVLFEGRLAAIAAPLMVGGWGAGAAFMLARHVSGWRILAAMERSPCLAPPQAWLDRTDRLRRALGLADTVAMRLTDAVLTPCVTHVLRPIIWLPASLMTRTPADQLEALIAHELAHIVRKDWLWNGLQSAIEALLFYHPAVWWLGKRIRQEREHACDDLAVSVCGDAIVLAEGLAGLERARQPQLGLAASGGALLQRVARLLSPASSRGGRGVLAMLSAMAVFGALLVGQVGLGGGQPHDMNVESSTPGPLGPGDYRQITANADNTQRF
jgi:hypothetical protein